MSHATEVFQPLQADDPPVVAGYRLAARLGAGGMGRVYLSHTQGGRPVAIKVVRSELADDPDFRRRFGREVKAARRVRGAYTAEVIDADVDGSPPWLATLYVPGPSLAEAVARRGPLPVPAVLWLMAGVAEALQAIHAESIVHRDLKPSNVLLAADGPRVIDFGVALAADGTAYTATGNTIGTPAYMAPEQASGEEVTAATDIFALGQTAAFAALGRPLYGDGRAINMMYRIVHSAPDLSLLPEPLRPLFARCLAADPAERPTPAEVVEWCRHRLGPDADADGGPAVWRETTGPEVVVPPPVSEPTPARTWPAGNPWPAAGRPQVITGYAGAPGGWPQPQAGYPYAATGWPQPPAGWRQPTPEERKDRRRRTALITAVAVAGGALLATALAWAVVEAENVAGRQDTARSSASATDRAGRPSAAAPGLSPGTSGATSPDSPGGTPRTAPSEPYIDVWLDTKHSVSLKNPEAQLTPGAGDIRMSCESLGCELDGDTSVFVPLHGTDNGSLALCRSRLADGKEHTLSLVERSKGSEICIKGPSGDIALLAISAKSTAVPDLAFLMGDMTIWRADA